MHSACYFCLISTNIGMCRQNLVKSLVSNIMKINSVVLKLLCTDRQGNDNKCIFATFSCKHTQKALHLFLSCYHFIKLAATDISHVKTSSSTLCMVYIEWHAQDTRTSSPLLGSDFRRSLTITHHLQCFKAYSMTLLHRQEHSPQSTEALVFMYSNPCSNLHAHKIPCTNTCTYNFSLHRLRIHIIFIITQTMVQ
jgi:hypothetical protein